MDVHIVFSGEYSDTRAIAVYTDPPVAKALSERVHEGHVETFTLDVFTFPKDLTYYHVSLAEDQTKVSLSDMWYDEVGNITRQPTDPPKVLDDRNRSIPSWYSPLWTEARKVPFAYVSLWARNEEEAVKIAAEVWAKYVAESDIGIEPANS